MSLPEVKTTRVWEGLEVEQYTNTATGQTEVYAVNQLNKSERGVKLAETFSTGTGDSTKNNWKITDQKRFRDLVNNRRRLDGQSNLNNDQFNQEFYLKGAQLFNQDRATVLNANTNYASSAAGDSFRQTFFQNNVPLVIDPKTKLQVSSTGKKGTKPVTGEQGGAGTGEENPGALENTDAAVQVELESQDQINAIIAARGRKRGGSTAVYRYPLKPDGPFEYDYISIQAYDYVPSLSQGIQDASATSLDYSARKNLGTGYETVILPMQPQLSETNGVSWSDDKLNPVQLELGKAAMTAIGDGFNLKNIQKAAQGLGQAAKNVLADSEIKGAVAAYFAGQAVGANLLGRTTGMVINPNLELLFNGPNLRTFNFNFKMTPRSPEESEVIRKIIYCFKRNMAVARSTSNLFLTSPRIFDLEYIYRGKEQHPYLNKFKPCAMTNFQVNYTPDGSYATFNQTGSLTQFDITMAFTEIMPIYAEDNKTEPDNVTSMGF
tara:strand:- start:270 stop:1745 length:1476 start_codon:yes stop_codon:yes gene_type:complete